jgi:hypothetical protein
MDSFFWQLDENIKIQMDKTNVEIFFMMFDLEMKKQQNEFAFSSIYTFVFFLIQFNLVLSLKDQT